MPVFSHKIRVYGMEIIQHTRIFIQPRIMRGHEIHAVIQFSFRIHERFGKTYKTGNSETHLIRNGALLPRFVSRKFCAPIVIGNVQRDFVGEIQPRNIVINRLNHAGAIENTEAFADPAFGIGDGVRLHLEFPAAAFGKNRSALVAVVLNTQIRSLIVLFDIRFIRDNVFGKIIPAVFIGKYAFHNAVFHDMRVVIDFIRTVVYDRFLFPFRV